LFAPPRSPPDAYKQLRGGVEAYAPEVDPGMTRY
jgi:hypothetical protein